MNAPRDGGTLRRVLIVDDEPVIRLMLSTFLGQKGWTCFQAGDPAGALEILGREPVGHALVDLHLGEHSGLDLIREIARRWPAVRIVAITGSVIGGPGVALSAGAAAVVPKPLSPLGLVLDALEGRTPPHDASNAPFG